MEHVTMYFHEIGSAFHDIHVLDDSGGGVDFLISGAPCIWVNVKNTLKPTYNSPITGDFGGPDNDSDEKPGQILGPDASTCCRARIELCSPRNSNSDTHHNTCTGTPGRLT